MVTVVSGHGHLVIGCVATSHVMVDLEEKKRRRRREKQEVKTEDERG
jgi:hypothetical protein